MSEPRDSEEFVRELTRSQTRLHGFIRCLLPQQESIDDILQETNLVLWRKASDFTPGSDFWAWASQVARFQVLSYLKQRSRDRHVFDVGLLEHLARIAAAQAETMEERQAALARCLEQLPPAQRQLLELRYSLHQSDEMIGATTNRPVNSIRQTLYRIREVLLRCIERRLATEGSS
jgi:RNA polymerase sigma-70 factor, ECF subfamily